MDDLLSEFLTETAESLAVIDLELVKFEQNPNDAEILQNIFRLVHTIKGTSGFLGLARLEKVAHAGEDVLGKFRAGELEVTPAAVTLILRAIDKIKELLSELERSGAEPEGDDRALIAELHAMAEGKAPAPEAAPAAPAAAAPAKAPAGPAADTRGFPVAKELLDEVAAAEARGKRAASDVDIAAEMANERKGSGKGNGAETPKGNGPATDSRGFPVAKELLDEVAAAEARGKRAASDADIAVEMANERSKQPAAEKTAKAPAVKTAAAGDGPKESAVAAQSIRVNVEQLETLMTLVSELVLTRNQLLQMVRGRDDSEFKVPLQRLSHITTDLQEGVMKTRMQPIGNAWGKLPRIVRDLAVETGKKIDLQMIGAETELDRQILELIKDPLTHMVRNSADHGLERPDARAAAGKPETGTITLNAFHEGGHIIIEIRDDGRGLNMDRIRQKALENGLATDAELESMTDQQIQQFIFKAGFSTAEKVTNVSGRGVGMDVVRTNIEKIGGTIELNSVAGRGSTFTIKIPLTLAIVSALIVECGAQRFAIPQISVLELVRASARTGDHRIEMINDSPVLRLRNRLLPLVSLKELLKLGEGQLDGEVYIVVTQVGNYTFGIVVDRVFDTEEIVVKPVSPILRDIPFYSGNTILGDGSVIMILDPNGIATATGEIASAAAHAAEAAVTSASSDGEKASMLIFRAGGRELKAIPLGLVARLEEIPIESMEFAHGQQVVQYRGRLMPLIPFSQQHAWKDKGRQPILVFADRERSMGLVVDEIVDIVEDSVKVELTADQPGLIGSAVIGGKATDVVDAGYFLTQAFEDWFGPRHAAAGKGRNGANGHRRILLVDDSPFFRNLLAPVLSVAGYEVRTAETAAEALKIRDAGERFDVIVSDIEMPGMNGFEFAQAVRADGRWGKTPLVALSAHTSPQDLEKGRKAGFNDYVAKFDREALVNTLQETVSLTETVAA